MPRPSWHDDLNQLKPIPLFNWQLNMRLLQWRAPKRIPPVAIEKAREADYWLRHDASGPTGPDCLAAMFFVIGWQKDFQYCRNLRDSIFKANRVAATQSHIFPHRTFPTEPHVHDAIIAEINSCFDPETFTLRSHPNAPSLPESQEAPPSEQAPPRRQGPQNAG